MKKKSLLSILLVVFPLLIAIGFSTWIIVYETVFTPERQISPLAEYFGVSQETIYNKEEQVPKQLKGETITQDRIQYLSKLETESEFQEVKPVEAGIYDVKIIVDGSDEWTIKFTIKQWEINVSQTPIEIDYSANTRTWDAFQLNKTIERKLVFTDAKTGAQVNLQTGDYGVTGMHNGDYFYGNVPNSNLYKDGVIEFNENLLGSTYLAYVNLTNESYVFANSSTAVVKYKTAKIGSTYYTIEDAISKTGNITLEGDATNTTSFVATSFCNLTKEEGNPYSSYEFMVNSRNLIVPFENSTKEYSTDKVAKNKGNVYSTLLIPNKITLNFSGTSTLTIAAYMGFTQPDSTITCERGVLMNNGIINIENNCKMNVYGYIKGKGIINLKSGAIAQDCIHTYDFPGGTAASNVYTKAFPTNAWTFHNNACETNIYAGAEYNGFINVIMSKTSCEARGNIIGTMTSSNCLFKPQSDNGYIKKKVGKANSWTEDNQNYKALFTITGSNQLKGQMDIIEVHGDYEDSTMKIGLKALVVTVNFTTSSTIATPLGFMKIILKKNNTLYLNKSDYLFYPGSSLTIEENATLKIGSGIDLTFMSNELMNKLGEKYTSNYFFAKNCVDKIDAECVINGTLNINGSISGNIKSSSSGGILNLSGGNLTTSFTMLAQTSSPYTQTVPDETYSVSPANGNIDGVQSDFEKSTYISTKNGNEYYWTPATNVKIYTFEFYDEDKTTLLETKEVQAVLNINNGDYSFNGSEYIPNKKYYDFNNWYDFETDTLIEEGKVYTDNTNPIKLYASWTETKYGFSYNINYIDSNETITNVTDSVNYTNKITEFTISNFINDEISITTEASYMNKYFNGWYVGIDINNKIELPDNKITLKQFNLFLENFNGYVPLYAEFTDLKKCKITFVDNNSKHSDFQDLDDIYSGNFIENLDSYYSKELQEFDLKNDYEFYFDGWYIDSKFTNGNKFTNSSIVTDNLTLYAKWTRKNTLELKNSKNETYENIYYKPGNEIEMLNGPEKDDDKGSEVNTKYSFDKWKIHGGSNDGKEYNIGDRFIPSTIAEEKIFAEPLYQEEKYCTITLKYGTADNDKGGSFNYTILNESNEEISTGSLVSNNESMSIKQNYIFKINSITYGDSNNKSAKIKIGNGSESNVADGSTFTIAAHTTITISSSCLVEGTLVTLADGSQKKVEDITTDDLVLVFNHETGTYDYSKILFITHENEKAYDYNIINLSFSNGTNLRIVGSHGLYDMDLQKYVYITYDNVEEYIGHKFYSAQYLNNQMESEVITLTNYTITNEHVRIFCPVSAYYMNCFADGLLTMPNIPFNEDGLVNIFEYDENMKYDEYAMKSDIEKYGLYTYEDFKEYFSYEAYLASPAKYLKISIGKGYLTYDEMIQIIKYLLENTLIE